MEMNTEKGSEGKKEIKVGNFMEVIIIDRIFSLRKVEHFLKVYLEFNN
jgi:hypothetical protein